MLNLSFIIFIISIFATTASAEILYEIEISRVESRELLGGLGESASLGEITEFYVPELSAPLISLPMDKAQVFNKNKIYIFKAKHMPMFAKYSICPSKKLDNACVECSECSQPEKLEILKKFDIKNVDNVRKKIVKTMGTAGININGKISVEFIFPRKGKNPLELVVKTEKFGPHVDVLSSFRQNGYQVSIYKSNDDPQYYLCPKIGFSQSCLVCENCSDKIEEIKSFKSNE